MRLAIGLLLSVAGGVRAGAQGAAVTAVMFDFSRPGIPVPAYRIELSADLSGVYEEGSPGTGVAARVALHVSSTTWTKLMMARDRVATHSCETRLKHIANTGRKTLTFREGAGTSACVFNYSDTESVNTATATLLGIAETVQAGQRLAAKHRFDRLGLDMEMSSLVDEVRGGRALEVGNIAPVLQSIVADDRVIDRVRRDAARLLQESGVTPVSPTDAPAGPPPSAR